MKKSLSLVLAIASALLLVSCAAQESPPAPDVEQNTPIEQTNPTPIPDSTVPDASPVVQTASGNYFSSLGTALPTQFLIPNFTIVQQDDYYYYSYSAPSDADLDGAAIYKMPVNGTESDVETLFQPSDLMNDYLTNSQVDLSSNRSEFMGLLSIRNLQVAGDWVYWANGTGIWRISTAGDDLQLVAQISNGQFNGGYHFWMDGEWVYHVDNTIESQLDSSTFIYQHRLMRTKIDGSDSEILFDAGTTREDDDYIYIRFITSDGRIYFTNHYESETDWYLWKDGNVQNLTVGFPEDIDKRIMSANFFIGENDEIYYFKYSIKTVYKENTFVDCLYLYQCNEDLSDISLTNTIDCHFAAYSVYSSTFPYVYGNTLYSVAGTGNSNTIKNYRFPLSEKNIQAITYFTTDTGDEYADATTMDAYRFNNDTPCLYNDSRSRFTTAGDGYLYYLTDDFTLCRALPDGTGWEDITWMVNGI